MNAVVAGLLKSLASRALMALLEAGVEELKKREDNTVDQNDVDRVKFIKDNNVFPKE